LEAKRYSKIGTSCNDGSQRKGTETYGSLIQVIGYYRIRDRRFIGGDDAIAIVVLPRPRCPAGLCHCALWFNLAAAGGDKDAAVPRDGLAKQMTPARIAEAQKLAREWKPKSTPAPP
jgi:hypothetical protein